MITDCKKANIKKARLWMAHYATFNQCDQNRGIKNSPIFSKVDQKSNHCSFYFKCEVFKIPQKSPGIVATFER